MKASRLFLPVLFAVSLLFTQQAGSAHLIRHTLEQSRQQDKKSQQHSQVCEKCATYAQMGNALQAATIDFTPPRVIAETAQYHPAAFRTIPVLAAEARGPPVFLQI
jgi:hypothetical protein